MIWEGKKLKSVFFCTMTLKSINCFYRAFTWKLGIFMGMNKLQKLILPFHALIYLMLSNQSFIRQCHYAGNLCFYGKVHVGNDKWRAWELGKVARRPAPSDLALKRLLNQHTNTNINDHNWPAIFLSFSICSSKLHFIYVLFFFFWGWGELCDGGGKSGERGRETESM